MLCSFPDCFLRLTALPMLCVFICGSFWWGAGWGLTLSKPYLLELLYAGITSNPAILYGFSRHFLFIEIEILGNHQGCLHAPLLPAEAAGSLWVQGRPESKTPRATQRNLVSKKKNKKLANDFKVILFPPQQWEPQGEKTVCLGQITGVSIWKVTIKSLHDNKIHG